jgi:hypothetical protein
MNRGTIQKIFVTAIVAIIAAGLLYFIYRTYKAYASGPSITVTEPANYASFSTSTVTIAGRAERVQDITLDSRSITIDNKGNFSETILLMPGYNIETISAHDPFGHMAKKQLELVYLAPKIATSSIATSTVATST